MGRMKQPPRWVHYVMLAVAAFMAFEYGRLIFYIGETGVVRIIAFAFWVLVALVWAWVVFRRPGQHS
jgi:hypothetical protein